MLQIGEILEEDRIYFTLDLIQLDSDLTVKPQRQASEWVSAEVLLLVAYAWGIPDKNNTTKEKKNEGLWNYILNKI